MALHIGRKLLQSILVIGAFLSTATVSCAGLLSGDFEYAYAGFYGARGGQGLIETAKQGSALFGASVGSLSEPRTLIKSEGGNGVQTVYGAAGVGVDPLGQPVIKLISGAQSKMASDSRIDARSYAIGMWQDRLQLSGATDFPDMLRIHVEVSGTLDYEQSGAIITSQLGLNGQTASPGAFEQDPSRISKINTNATATWDLNGLVETPVIRGLDGLTQPSSSDHDIAFVAQYSFLVNEGLHFDPSQGANGIGTYDYILITRMSSIISHETQLLRGGTLQSDLSHTIRIVAVTTVDGQSIDDLNPVFASQEATSPLPEPSSLVLLGLGICGLLGYRMFRRKTSSRTTRGPEKCQPSFEVIF
jgi:hypothetical protein